MKSDKTKDRLIPLAFLGTGEKAEIVEMRGFRHRAEMGQCLEDPEVGPHGHHGHKPYRRAHRGHSDRGHRWVHRLNCLGLIPGEEITVIKNDVSAPLILGVKGSRICLGRGIAFKVLVRPSVEATTPDPQTEQEDRESDIDEEN